MEFPLRRRCHACPVKLKHLVTSQQPIRFSPGFKLHHSSLTSQLYQPSLPEETSETRRTNVGSQKLRRDGDSLVLVKCRGLFTRWRHNHTCWKVQRETGKPRGSTKNKTHFISLIVPLFLFSLQLVRGKKKEPLQRTWEKETDDWNRRNCPIKQEENGGSAPPRAPFCRTLRDKLKSRLPFH